MFCLIYLVWSSLFLTLCSTFYWFWILDWVGLQPWSRPWHLTPALQSPSTHAVLQQHSQGTTRRLHANLDRVFVTVDMFHLKNVTGTSSEYYICITSAAQSDCLTSVIQPKGLKLSMQTCKYRNPGKYLRTLNIYYLKKYRRDIIDFVQQLDMHKIYRSVQ